MLDYVTNSQSYIHILKKIFKYYVRLYLELSWSADAVAAVRQRSREVKPI